MLYLNSFIHSTQLADRIFLNQQSDKSVEDVQEVLDVAIADVLTTFSAAEQDFKKRLKSYTIANLMQNVDSTQFGEIDWR